MSSRYRNQRGSRKKIRRTASGIPLVGVTSAKSEPMFYKQIKWGSTRYIANPSAMSTSQAPRPLMSTNSRRTLRAGSSSTMASPRVSAFPPGPGASPGPPIVGRDLGHTGEGSNSGSASYNYYLHGNRKVTPNQYVNTAFWYSLNLAKVLLGLAAVYAASLWYYYRRYTENLPSRRRKRRYFDPNSLPSSLAGSSSGSSQVTSVLNSPIDSSVFPDTSPSGVIRSGAGGGPLVESARPGDDVSLMMVSPIDAVAERATPRRVATVLGAVVVLQFVPFDWSLAIFAAGFFWLMINNDFKILQMELGLSDGPELPFGLKYMTAIVVLAMMRFFPLVLWLVAAPAFLSWRSRRLKVLYGGDPFDFDISSDDMSTLGLPSPQATAQHQKKSRKMVPPGLAANTITEVIEEDDYEEDYDSSSQRAGSSRRAPLGSGVGRGVRFQAPPPLKVVTRGAAVTTVEVVPITAALAGGGDRTPSPSSQDSSLQRRRRRKVRRKRRSAASSTASSRDETGGAAAPKERPPLTPHPSKQRRRERDNGRRRPLTFQALRDQRKERKLPEQARAGAVEMARAVRDDRSDGSPSGDAFWSSSSSSSSLR